MYKSKIKEIVFTGSFPHLETLHLAENELKEFSFINFPNLKTLYLYKNPLTNIPKELFDEERKNVWQGVRNHLVSLIEDGVIPNDQIKLLLLGNSTAGKSSLIEFLTEGKYEKDKVSTHGIEHIVWQPYKDDLKASEKQRNLKVAIWDFGGQEFYHNTHALFFSNNAIYVVVFEESTNFQGTAPTKIYLYEDEEKVKKEMYNVDLEHFDYSYWLDNVEHFNREDKDNSLKLLVQNKLDISKEVKVSEECREKYNLKRDNQIVRISIEGAYDKNRQFVHNFYGFKLALLGYIESHIDKFDNSTKAQEIKNKIQEEWVTENVLTFDEYVKKCQSVKPTIHDKANPTDESQLDSLTKSFHKQGVLLHFRHIEGLENKVFVNPKWLLDCIYRVLHYSLKNKRDPGQFDVADIEKVAQKMGKMSATEIEQLLLHFNLIFEVEKGGKKRLIAPQYLSESFSTDQQELIEELETSRNIQPSFTLSYPDFLPVSTFLRFLAEYGSKHHRCWYNKNELVFKKDNKFVFAKCTRTKDTRQISIRIENNDAALRSEIFHKLYEISPIQNVEILIEGKSTEKYSDIINPKMRLFDNKDYDFVRVGELGGHIKGEMKGDYYHYEDDFDREKMNQKENTLKNSPYYKHGYALLIGISYKNWKIHNKKPLNGATKDIEDLAKHFKDRQKAAYHPDNVIELPEEKATAAGILNALEELKQRTESDNEASVIVYYSGHGGSYNNRHFLVPYDFELQKYWDAKSNNLPFDSDNVVDSAVFRKKLDAIKAHKMLVFLDCCHSEGMTKKGEKSIEEPFLKGLMVELGSQVTEKGIAQDVHSGIGRIILASCEAHETSLDLETNGLFTEVLLECLNGVKNIEKDGWVRFKDILNYVQGTVQKRAKDKYNHNQSPVFNEIKGLKAEDFKICAYNLPQTKNLDASSIIPPNENPSFPETNTPNPISTLQRFKEELLDFLEEEQHNGIADLLGKIKNSGYKYDKSKYTSIDDLLTPDGLANHKKSLIQSTKSLIHSLTEKKS
ncbi:MAG: caspase family protein [Bacteroidia bacterium]|nr:caspase family protein [Bacteroidia bacterium]